jgi:hypothetical protein
MPGLVSSDDRIGIAVMANASRASWEVGDVCRRDARRTAGPAQWNGSAAPLQRVCALYRFRELSARGLPRTMSWSSTSSASIPLTRCRVGR